MSETTPGETTRDQPSTTATRSAKPSAMLVIKRRQHPVLAAIVTYDLQTGRKGKVLASEPIAARFSNADLLEAARRLVDLVPTHDVILPTGVDL